MEYLKKKRAGFYAAGLTAIAGIAGLVFYLINCGTAYFANMGIHPGVVGFAVCAVAAVLAYMAIPGTVPPLLRDALPVLSGVLLVAAFTLFLSLRVNSIATIMTFENNAQTMSDLSSALVGMVCCLAAVILNIITSFLKADKE